MPSSSRARPRRAGRARRGTRSPRRAGRRPRGAAASVDGLAVQEGPVAAAEVPDPQGEAVGVDLGVRLRHVGRRQDQLEAGGRARSGTAAAGSGVRCSEPSVADPALQHPGADRRRRAPAPRGSALAAPPVSGRARGPACRAAPGSASSIALRSSCPFHSPAGDRASPGPPAAFSIPKDLARRWPGCPDSGRRKPVDLVSGVEARDGSRRRRIV